MTFRLALRLLPLLAVLNLALTPVAASAAMHAAKTAHATHETMPGMNHAGMTGTDMAGMDMDDVPCCPPEKPAKPDCAKAGCPLLALCLASVASLRPAAVSFRSGASRDSDEPGLARRGLLRHPARATATRASPSLNLMPPALAPARRRASARGHPSRSGDRNP